MTSGAPMHIAVGSIFIECNQFGGTPADLARFGQYELLRGEEMLGVGEGVVGGMLTVLHADEAHIHPLLVASTCSSGPVTRDCYEQLTTELLAALVPEDVDGVLLGLHGSGVVEPATDLEGDLLAAVRQHIGPELPLVATLDLHAHVSEAMVHNADALVAWETYPHKDAFSTGQRGARLLMGIVGGKWQPAMAVAKVPVLVGGCRGQTEGDGAFPELMRRTKSFEAREGVLSTSLFMVHPYLDFAGMGGGGLVITDNDMDLAVELSTDIAERYWQSREALEQPLMSPDAAIRKGLEIDGGPVLLIETADCAGGGAAGDSIASIRALLDAELDVTSLAMVVDPEAAAACHAAGTGSELRLSLGHKLDPHWGEPIEVTGTVERISDGNFRYDGGIWADSEASMGPAAVFTADAVKILIATHATYDWADEQFRSMQLKPDEAKFVVVKNPMNYRFGYADITKAAFILDTPGPTPASVRGLQYKHMQQPYFPVDTEISELQPTVLQSPTQYS